MPDPRPDPDGPPARPLTEPRDGVPPLVDTPAALRQAAARLAAGTGPVAVDAERASGYRYGQRAFLVQLRRAGTGTLLVDPVPLPDLSVLAAALGPAEWVLHAAGQDLTCLAEVGLRPGGALFDTELAARLAGRERVGLAAVVEEMLGWSLAKEHSAVDWSTRPLPEPWLRYAALDVEVLLELREVLGAELAEQGKTRWAQQEFDAVRDAPPPAPRAEPWRRTSGLHQVRNRRGLAVVRAVWTARDEIARRRDVAPGRVLPDRAVVSAATRQPATLAELTSLPVFSGPANRRIAARWMAAIDQARALPDPELPSQSLPSEGPPPPRVWRDRDPAAAARLAAARSLVEELSETHRVPAQNLLTPDLLRRLCWQPPEPVTQATVTTYLLAAGARRWQADLLAGPLACVVEAAGDAAAPADPSPPPD